MNEAYIKSKSSRNVYLDLFKILLDFFIICIHLSGEDYAIYPLYRLAVPMFFMISGYFLYSNDCDKERKKSVAFIIRSAKYMLVGILFYTIYELIFCIVDGTSIGWFFTTLFYDGEDIFLQFFIFNAPIPYYTVGAQIWFLIALFVCSLIHFFLVRFKKTNYYKIIIPIALIVYFFFSGFMYLIQPDTALFVRYMRNAWFFGLPNFAIGYLLGKRQRCANPQKQLKKYIYLISGIIFFFLQILEAKIYPDNSKMEMYLTSIISAICLISFFMSIDKTQSRWYYDWIGKSASFYIYILHMGVAVVLARFVTFGSAMQKSLVVFVVSFVIYEILFLCNKLFSHIKHTKMKVA